ncbi:MAG: hypothetical protein ACREH3_09145, partial [Geminicoccales bacterium]
MEHLSTPDTLTRGKTLFRNLHNLPARRASLKRRLASACPERPPEPLSSAGGRAPADGRRRA